MTTRPREAELHQTATRLFRERGFHATSMQDLAEALGMNRGSLYHYIESKDDLLWAIVDGGFRTLEERVLPLLDADAPGTERLAAAIEAHLAVASERTDELTLLQMERRALSPERLAEIIRRRDAYEAAFRRAIRDGVATGDLRPVNERMASIAVLSLCNWFTQWYRPDGPMTPGEIADVFTEPLPRRPAGAGVIARLSSATVLGAGTMGAQIACLLAGAGARVRLLDLDADTARGGLERAVALRPSPVYRASDAERIATGGFEELADAARGSDWVIEVIVEQLDPKRELLDRLEEALGDRPAADWPLVSTNTSGIPIASLAEGRTEAFRTVFLGTHFFNPPRYARLLELIPLASTDPGRIAWIEDYGSRLLGKGTVIAKDRPAFIANRLGVHGLLTALALAQELGLGVDEVDELTGPLIGRPRSATFRTLDLVGLDVAAHVADNLHAALPDDPQRDAFAVPPVMRELIESGSLGEKTGAGFFRREDGEILAYDLETGEYRPRRRVESAAVELARGEPDLPARLALLVAAEDRAGEFLRRLIGSGLDYAAAVGPEIADSAAAVDQRHAMGLHVGARPVRDRPGAERRGPRGPGRPLRGRRRRGAAAAGIDRRRRRAGLAGWGPAAQRRRLAGGAARWRPRAGAARQAQPDRRRYRRHDRARSGHGGRALRRARDRHVRPGPVGRRQPRADADGGRGGRVG